VPTFDEDNARLAGISRNDLARSLAYNSLGITIGLMRDGDKLIPIIARAPDAERADLSGLMNRQIWSPSQRQYVPMSQIVSEFKLDAANTTIFRRDRIRTLTARANAPRGHNINQYFQRVQPDVEAIELPPGYKLEWGGEFEANDEANESLLQRMPMAFGMMFFITMLMFGALKQPIVIWLTVPMIVCGVALGLLITNLPLTFPSFLGILSLAGMLIKNCIVLVDEIDKRLAEGDMTTYTMMMASISRLRPVMLASLTTIFGMSPLLTDDFFREMAVCIMSGLLFATLLTLVAVPVFYRIALTRQVRTV
jgi:multidrug efflux pump subunit AcrB